MAVLDHKLTRVAAGSSPFKSGPAYFSGDLINDPLYQLGKPLVILWNNAMNQAFIVAGHTLYQIKPAANGDLNSELILRGFDFQKEQITGVYYDQKAGRIFLGFKLNGLIVLTRNKYTPAAAFPGTDQVYYGQALMNARSILSGQGIVYAMDEADNKSRPTVVTDNRACILG